MIKIKNRYLFAIMLFFATTLKAFSVKQAFSKVKEITLFNKIFNKENKVKNIDAEFEELQVSKGESHETLNPKFDGLSINKFQLEQGRIHQMSKSNLKERFGFLAADIDKNQVGIRACHQFIPYNYDLTKKPIVVAVIHGTFVPESPDYYSTYSDFYQNVCEFAKKEAIENRTTVEIISLQWSGKNSTIDRKNASVVLAEIFNKFYSHYDIYTIAHSHGCNVVNSASRFLHDNLFIKHAIHLACPVRDLSEEDFKPKQFHKLTQFYSSGDAVAAIGSLNQYNWIFSAGNCRKFEQQDDKITNIRVLLNGQDATHSNAKNDILRYLPKILEQLNNYKVNRDLTLNVDRNQANPVLISIRNAAKDNSQTLNYTAAELALEKAILDLELNYSKTQSDIFYDIYKKNMNDKNNRFYRFLNGLYHEIF